MMTPTRIILKFKKLKCWLGNGTAGILIYCRWKCKLVKPLWKTASLSWLKLNICLTYDPEIPPKHKYICRFTSSMYKKFHSSII